MSNAELGVKVLKGFHRSRNLKDKLEILTGKSIRKEHLNRKNSMNRKMGA